MVLGASYCSPLAHAPLDEASAARLAPLFKALADPARLRLISLIATHAGGEACVSDISETIDLSQPTVSHHLKTLRLAGLLGSERRPVRGMPNGDRPLSGANTTRSIGLGRRTVAVVALANGKKGPATLWL